MNTTNHTTETTPSRTHLPPALKRALLAGGIFLVVAFALYWAGLSHGKAEMAQQKTADAVRLKTVQTQVTDAQDQIAALRNQNQLMTARGLLYQAAIALDRCNFGIANDDITKAQKALAAAQPSMSADATQLTQIRQSISGTTITVAQELETRRMHILDLTSQLNVLIH